MRADGLEMLPMGSVGPATAEALCAALPLAPPQAQLQSYTYKAAEALAGYRERSCGSRRALRWRRSYRRDTLRRRKTCCEVDDQARIGLYCGFR
jgi:hypothetical protein